MPQWKVGLCEWFFDSLNPALRELRANLKLVRLPMFHKQKLKITRNKGITGKSRINCLSNKK